MTEEENADVVINAPVLDGIVSKGQLCIMGKLLTERFVSKEIIKSKLIKVWQPTGSLSFKVLGENLFLIEFEHSWDKIRVMEGRPWVFEGSLFSIAEFDGITQPAKIEFEKVTFWVRMFHLPLACMGSEVGFQIRSSMGTVEEVETNEDGVRWGKYLRVRIILDLNKPLSRGRKLQLNGKSVLIEFKYERLPRFCFFCGCIRHVRNGCLKRSETRNRGTPLNLDFG